MIWLALTQFNIQDMAALWKMQLRVSQWVRRAEKTHIENKPTGPAPLKLPVHSRVFLHRPLFCRSRRRSHAVVFSFVGECCCDLVHNWASGA